MTFSFPSRRSTLISFLALSIVSAVLLGSGVPLGPVGWVLAPLLLLILPGYGAVRIFFPQGDDGIEAAAATFGVSIGLLIGIGLVLNALPGGLNRVSFAAGEGALSCLLLSVALRRSRPGTPTRQQSVSLSGFRVGLLGLSILIAIGAVTVAAVASNRQYHPGFTQLWLYRSPSGGSNLVIGVRSVEHHPMRYRLRVESGGVNVLPPISLSRTNESAWTRTVHVPAARGKRKIVVLLYLSAHPNQVYRHVSFWFNA
ncbi:MAG: DUF1616 domain-containing protein [Chloroflexota bacterium]